MNSDQRNALRPGCGSKAGLFLVILILAIVVGVALWAWRGHPPETPVPAGTAAPPTPPAESQRPL